MPFPAGLTLVSVHGRVDSLPSGGTSGQACFMRPYALVGGADNSIVPPRPEYATLSATGEFTILLPATNDPDWTPVNWPYAVEIVSSSGVIRGTLQLNYLNTAVELADLIQIDGAAVAGTTYIPLSSRGVVLGVAALDGDGDVNNAAGAKILGGSGTPSASVVAETGYGQASAAGAATAYSRGDHTHGTPALGTSGTTAAAGNHTHAYLPLTGGTVSGNVTIQDAGATKSYGLRSSGASLDLEGAGADLFLSVWSGAGATGTQRNYARLESGAALAHALGRWVFAGSAFTGTYVLDADPTAGTVGVGAKNSLTPIVFAGFRATAGAPTTGTWATGDVVLDSAGAWHLCTTGGTPGTWTNPAGGSTLVVKRAVVSSGNITPQNTAGAWAALTGGPTLVIPAAAGDYLSVEIMGLLMTKDSATFYDLAVLNGASLVRFGSSGTGTPAAEGDGSLYHDTAFPRSGTVFDFVAASGDINAGNITICFAVKSGGVGTLHAGFYPLRWRVMNHGVATVS